jgi:hypothetical protein
MVISIASAGNLPRTDSEGEVQAAPERTPLKAAVSCT